MILVESSQVSSYFVATNKGTKGPFLDDKVSQLEN